MHTLAGMPRRLKPLKGIRRFDVFAESPKLAAGGSLPHDQPEGYGLWLAKVAAAHKIRAQAAKRGDQHRASGAR